MAHAGEALGVASAQMEADQTRVWCDIWLRSLVGIRADFQLAEMADFQ